MAKKHGDEIPEVPELPDSSTDQDKSLSERMTEFTQNVQIKNSYHPVRKALKTGTKKIARRGKQTLKSGFEKVNPLNQPINKNDTADHGVESLKLAYRTGKKTVQTTKSSAQTVKAAGRTVKAVVHLPRTIVNTVRTTVHVTVTTVRVTANVLVHIAAALLNPVTWIIALACVIIYVILGMVVVIMGGASIQETAQTFAYTQQAGIGSEEEMEEASEFYRLACERNKTNFSDLIYNIYFSTSDLKNSSLIYMERNANGGITQYTRGFATDAWKQTLTSTWMITVPENEATAIAYVYLESQKNAENGTEQQIYPIEYTQEVFNEIVDAAVKWSDITYPNQYCDERKCSEHHDEHPNPAYQTASDNYTQCITRRDDFNTHVVPAANNYNYILEQYNNVPAAGKGAMQNALNDAWAELEQAFRNWEYVFGYTGWELNEYTGYNGSAWLQQFVDGAWDAMQNTPQTITTTYWTCDHLHTLHSVGLFTYDKETVMNALGFSQADKKWEQLIELGMTLDEPNEPEEGA